MRPNNKKSREERLREKLRVKGPVPPPAKDELTPKDNPFLGTNNVYLRMQWDQDHGFADYS